jgi:ABC-type polysaccharide/polyol phosphate transport system ATPase subunit
MKEIIKIENLNLFFPIYGQNSISLKKRIIKTTVGGVLKIKELNNDVTSVHALKNINLKIYEGDKIGIIGHNGSGKSSLLRCIAGIYKPSTGIINVKGKISCLLSVNEGIDMEASGLENIFIRGRLIGLSNKEISKTIGEIIEFSDLNNFIYLPLRTYSSGMVARLCFSIAAMINPDILLIDESLGTGDKQFLLKIKKKTKELVNRSKVAIYVSHDYDFLTYIDVKIIEFKNGEIVRNDLIKY